MDPFVTLLVAWLIAFALALVPERLSPRSPTVAAWVAVAASALTAGVALSSNATSFSADWVPVLGLSWELGKDPYADVFLAVVGVVGVAVFGYTAHYFKGKAGSGRFVAGLAAFALAMIGLILSQDVFTLFVFWEATTFASYLLIGHHRETSTARLAARQAALTTGMGGLVLLAGLIVLASEAGSSEIAAIVEARPTSTIGWVLVVIGAMTKSAQVPFHSWLPSAMAAPTPASAFLHSATMVKAGILLLGRLGPGAADVSWWTPTVLAIGLATMLIGGWAALKQHDLKLLLANGTVSQLGLLFGLIGSGSSDLVAAGLALLVAHALYKSSLFLVVGVVDATQHTRDLRKLTGLWSKTPWLTAVAVVAAGSMAGLVFTLGFVAKESLLEEALDMSGWFALLIAAVSAISVAYTARFAMGGFLGPRAAREREPWGLLSGPLGLTALSTALALVPFVLGPAISSAASAVFGTEVQEPKLVVWPGLVPAFGLSMAGLVAGAVIGWLSLRREDTTSSISRSHRFDRGIDIIQTWAGRLTGFIQNGSLPVYLGQILLVAMVAPLPALVRLGAVPVPVDATGTGQWVVTIGVAGAAGALLTVRRRMVAVLLLGAVGYGMSALFAINGAPDVALTQLLVETLVVALFALALRVVPRHFNAPLGFSPWKAMVAIGSGLVMAWVALASTGVEHGAHISEELLTRSVPEAAGANVVNVTLVDFRAMDTLGEITVLAVAALGVLALVRPIGEKFRVERFSLRSSPILTHGAAVAGPILLLFSFYLLMAGHNQPGGGFAAGLVASSFVILNWLSKGREGIRRSTGVEPSVLIGSGLALAILVGLGGYLWGDMFGTSAVWEFDLPVFGSVKAVTALAFDAGVAVVVFGSVVAALRGLEAS